MNKTEMTFRRVSYGGKPYQITIESSDDGAAEALNAAWIGSKWIKFNNGKLEVSNHFRRPPEVEDTDMESFWPVDNVAIQGEFNYTLREYSKPEGFSPSITIEHIQGYSGNYNKKAKLLKEVGFVCLRSPRDENGQYWEIWRLSGDWQAKGPIKGKNIEEIKKWVFKNIAPGNLYVTGQSYGLCIPD